MARLSDLTAAPPVVSLLDVDFYKFTMGQYAFRRHPNAVVRYRLICRTPDAHLPGLVPREALRDALEAIRSLSFTPAELAYLEGLPPAGLFGGDFLAFLADLRLPPVRLDQDADGFRLEVEAAWPEAILWETLILSALSELLGRAALAAGGAGAREAVHEVGRERLARKIEALRERPGIRFASFGTRRRHSRVWQFEVEECLARLLPRQFAGTSCVASAYEHGLAPVGTIAHEVFMVCAVAGGSADGEIRRSAGRVPESWWEMYGEPFSVFLTDTWGSGFFFGENGEERARRYRGVRHDSGDPVAFGERVIGWYEGLGVNPRGKTLVFSDGLELRAILDLDRRFADRIRVSYGWGTNLTNDCGLPNYSLVVKPVAVNGRPVVKLSDNPAKSSGAPAEIARYRRIFGAKPGAALLPKY